MKTKTTSNSTDRLNAADEILLRVTADDRSPNFEELNELYELGYDRNKIQSELARAARVLRSQRIAGTAKARQELEKRLEECRITTAQRQADIDEAIERLQLERKTVTSELRMLETRSSDVAHATETLKQNLPEHIKNKYSMAVGNLDESLLRPILDLQTERGELVSITGTEPGEHKGRNLWLDSVARNNSEYVQTQVVDGYRVRQLSAKYFEDKPGLVARIQEIDSEIKELQAEYDAERAKIDELLNHYLLEG